MNFVGWVVGNLRRGFRISEMWGKAEAVGSPAKAPEVDYTIGSSGQECLRKHLDVEDKASEKMVNTSGDRVQEGSRR